MNSRTTPGNLSTVRKVRSGISMDLLQIKGFSSSGSCMKKCRFPFLDSIRLSIGVGTQQASNQLLKRSWPLRSLKEEESHEIVGMWCDVRLAYLRIETTFISQGKRSRGWKVCSMRVIQAGMILTFYLRTTAWLEGRERKPFPSLVPYIGSLEYWIWSETQLLCMGDA